MIASLAEQLFSAVEETTLALLAMFELCSDRRHSVFGPAALPYQLQLVLLCEASHRLGGAIDGAPADELERWFWKTTLGESFTGISNKDVWQAINCVWDAVAGKSADLRWEYPTAIMPFTRFRANSVRSRALALLLVRSSPRDADNNLFDGARMLADLGAKAVPKIIPASDLPDGGDGPENRWSVHSRHLKAMRDLLGPNIDPHRDEILLSHYITPEARNLYVAGNFSGFLDARRNEILKMERAFVEALDLAYAEDYEPFRQV